MKHPETGIKSPRRSSVGVVHLVVLSLILLVSGYCSLAYQVVWIREFRLIFGGTTGAMAAVLAVFMGGLGFGGAVLGRCVERASSPLFYYGLIELGISVTAAVTPVLLVFVRRFYFETGGEAGLGYGVATLLRGGMTLVVIGLPCFLMGGTLPAAAKHLQHNADRDRKVTGWLYGINIVGAFAGVVVTTFLTLEHLGSRGSLQLAASLNVFLGLAALGLCRIPPAAEIPARQGAGEDGSGETEMESQDDSRALPDSAVESPSGVPVVAPSVVPVSLCYGAAFVTGLVFFMLELVWYRMSVPLTGGSVYALGMVLMVALLGLALGGGCYVVFGRWIGHRPGIFALLGAVQAAVILVPYLLGDMFAWRVALAVGEVKEGGWSETIVLWIVTISAIALLPSIIAGIQFPLLLSMLGCGGEKIGRQLGHMYAWNTGGAIAGALLGGFLLLPLLGAENLWVLSAGFCAVLALVFLRFHLLCAAISERRRFRHYGISLVTVVLLLATVFGVAASAGPGAYWRHSAIGFGRIESVPKTAARRMEVFAMTRDSVLEEWEGRETSVAVTETSSRALINNGKSDSSLHGDNPTTIGLSLIPALVHSSGVRSAAVIGAGTGVSAGWLAAFPGVEKVDLYEIEPAVIKAQRWFAEGNLDPLSNPVVEVVLGDAREALATRGRKYDTIISEPSNLTRSGICNFYTVEYYQQCARRMNERAIFAQWLQGYDLDLLSLGQVIKTMLAVFPRVELWVTKRSDLVLLGSFDEAPYDLERIKERMKHPVYQRALILGFQTDSAEGFFARFLVDSEVMRRSVENGVPVNVDDRNTLEFRIARNSLVYDSTPIRKQLVKLFKVADVGQVIDGYLRSSHLQEERLSMYAETIGASEEEPDEKQWLLRAFWNFGKGNYPKVREVWIGQARTLKGKLYLAMTAAVSQGPYEEEFAAIRDAFPAEVKLLLGLRKFHQGVSSEGMAGLREGFAIQRQLNWASEEVVGFLLKRLGNMLRFMNREELEEFFELIEPPFPSSCQEYLRQRLLRDVACYLGEDHKRRFLQRYEGRIPSTGIAMAIAAELPEREDARKALERFLQMGGELPSGFSAQREVGVGLANSLRKKKTFGERSAE